MKLINGQEIEYIDHVVLQHESEMREAIDFILADGPIRNVIEIGTYEGGTAYIWGQLVSPMNGRVHCVDVCFGSYPVDVWNCPASNHIEAVYRHTLVEENIVEVKGRSEDPVLIEWVRRSLGDEKVDLLFHDGDHSYEAVKRDFENYAPFVRLGGWIAICDWMDETHGVSRFWPELKAKYETHEFVIQRMPKEKQKSHRWLGYLNGIGLVRWEGMLK
jgi:cephalosporin hydroxylase